MKKIALLLFGFSVLFFSCEKEGNNQIVIENTGIPLISKVLYDGQISVEYVYNQSNLLSEEKSKFHYTKHTYNSENQLITSDFYWDVSMASSNSAVIQAAMERTEWVTPDNTPKSVSHELSYNADGQLFRKSYNRTNDESSDFTEFQYDGGRITKETGYYNGSVMGFTTYEYDSKGNVAKELKYMTSPYGVTELTATTEYEYDDMHNPFQAFKRLTTPGVYTNPNNILKQTYTLNFDVDPYTEKVQVTTNKYEYNSEGYPSKVNGTVEYQYE
jgi:hypothetical protein